MVTWKLCSNGKPLAEIEYFFFFPFFYYAVGYDAKVCIHCINQYEPLFSNDYTYWEITLEMSY